MAYKSGVCYICEEVKPVDSHHVHPLEYGGRRDGLQVMLCKTCHSLAHYESETYQATGKYQNVDTSNHNLMYIISQITVAGVLFKTGQLEGADEQRRTTAISWDSEEEKAMAHEVKRALKFRSLDRAIKYCVYSMYQALVNKGKI